MTRATVDSRFFKLVERVRTSFWAVPTLLALAAVVVARGAVAVDYRVTFGETAFDAWLYQASPRDARALLATLAGSMITVAGVVFSITIVALSFASSHIGPRLLRNFMRDRGTQVVLGTFVASFLYSLVVMATIRGSADTNAVPRLAVSLGIVLATASFGFLIYFIHHVSTSIQVDHVVAAVRRELDATVDRMYPRERAHEGADEPTFDGCEHALPSVHSGYVQAVDYEHVAETAAKAGVRVRCSLRPGQFVVTGGELARADGALSEKLTEHFCKAFVVGSQRTGFQDVEHSIRQLVEIALRALSPGVNDPFTAISCIDHLGAALARIGPRPTPAWSRWSHAGELRVESPAVTFEGAMDAAWNQLRQHGAAQPAVAIRLLESLARIAPHARDPRSVTAHARLCARTAEREIAEEHDRAAVAERLQRLLAAVADRAGAPRTS